MFPMMMSQSFLTPHLICPYSARRKRKQALYYKGDYIENLVLCATMCQEVFSGEYFKLQLKAS